MDGDAWTATFSYTCSLCGERVEVVDGFREDHSCPTDPHPTVVISGCDNDLNSYHPGLPVT